MKCLLLLSTLFIYFTSIAQTDTSKIYNCKIYKKGFYKNYQEYLNNAPSVTEPFTVVPLAKSNTDTTIIGATYKLENGNYAINNVWGFCDGTDIYVKYASGLFSKRYWKLQYVGLYPFFTFKHREKYVSVPSLSGLIAIAAAVKAMEYDIMLVDRDGDVREPTFKVMKILLRDQPDLLKSFSIYAKRYQNSQPYNYESAQTYAEKMRLIRDYLIRLNEVSKN